MKSVKVVPHAHTPVHSRHPGRPMSLCTSLAVSAICSHGPARAISNLALSPPRSALASLCGALYHYRKPHILCSCKHNSDIWTKISQPFQKPDVPRFYNAGREYSRSSGNCGISKFRPCWVSGSSKPISRTPLCPPQVSH